MVVPSQVISLGGLPVPWKRATVLPRESATSRPHFSTPFTSGLKRATGPPCMESSHGRGAYDERSYTERDRTGSTKLNSSEPRAAHTLCQSRPGALDGSTSSLSSGRSKFTRTRSSPSIRMLLKFLPDSPALMRIVLSGVAVVSFFEAVDFTVASVVGVVGFAPLVSAAFAPYAQQIAHATPNNTMRFFLFMANSFLN